MSDDPRRKGRPPKLAGKRTFKIDVRFTEEEYKLITEMEQVLGLSRAKLIRARVLDNGTGLILNAKALIQQLGQIGTELGRTGNNLNQLAHYANILKLKNILSPVLVERFNLLLESHLKTRTELNASLRKIIRSLGH
jgi:hypothetical protein